MAITIPKIRATKMPNPVPSSNFSELYHCSVKFIQTERYVIDKLYIFLLKKSIQKKNTTSMNNLSW